MSATFSSPEPWLLADVGGTNVRFALADPQARAPLQPESVRAYRAADFSSFAEAARRYLATVTRKPAHAVFAFAGPVRGAQVQMTNLSWTISGADLQQSLALQSVSLVNDFAAMGMGLPLLTSRDLKAIGPAVAEIVRRPGRQTFCVLGPGTGLGVSALVAREGDVVGLETEGGHSGFAPSNDEEIAVLRHLSAHFGRVSNERLLCGSGLVNLHEALCAIAGEPAPALSPEEITTRAGQSADPHSVRAVELFCDLLGSFAGDCALAYGAWDGVYLGGGLLAPLLPWLTRGGFRARFDAKGRFSDPLARVPVALIVHPHPGLLGCAAFAVTAAGRPLLRERARA